MAKGKTTELHQAAAEPNTKRIYELLATSPKDLMATDRNGKTPLHYAVGHEDNMVLLLAAGINPNVADNMGWTALHFAVYASDIPSIRLLIAKANVNAVNEAGHTPLHIALDRGGKNQKNIIQALLRMGAKKELLDSDYADRLIQLQQQWMSPSAIRVSEIEKIWAKEKEEGNIIRRAKHAYAARNSIALPFAGIKQTTPDTEEDTAGLAALAEKNKKRERQEIQPAPSLLSRIQPKKIARE